MADSSIGPKVVVEGEKEFKAAMQSVTNEFKLLDSQMKLAVSQFDKNDKSTAALTAKNQVLGKEIESQKSKVSLLTERYDKQNAVLETLKSKLDSTKSAFAADSKEVAKAQKEYNTQATTVNKLNTELNGASAGLNKINNAMKINNTQIKEQTNSFGVLNNKLKELDITLQSTGQNMSAVGGGMSVAITAPILAGAGAGLKFNATMEDFTANFETMLGSADKAQSMLAELSDFAKSTPFEMAGLADSAKILLNFGIDSKDVMNTIGMLGDVSMGNQEKLSRITLAFGQIQSTGRLMGQDLNQLINSGFNPLQVISEKTGRSMANLKKDMEDGAISADMVTGAFKSATSEGGMFFGAMDKGSKTANGQMSTLKDTINITLGDILIPLFKEFTNNILPNVIKKVESLGKYFKSLSEDQKLNVLKWAGIAAAIGPVLLIVGKLITTIPALVAGINLINAAFTFLAANPIILAISALVIAIGMTVYAFGETDRAVRKTTATMIEEIEKQTEAQKKAIDEIHKAKIEALNKELTSEETSVAEQLKIIQKEYDAEIKSINKKEQALKKSVQERQKTLDSAYKDSIKQIQDEYGVFEDKQKSKTAIVQDEANAQKDIVKEVLALSKDISTQEGQAFSKTYDAILKKAREIHDEKIMMYQQEYLKSVSLINQDLANTVNGLNSQIASLENKTDEENRILKEQDDANKIIELEKAIRNATTDEERRIANQELATELNRQNREKELENRRIQIESLQTQVQNEIIKANEKKQNALDILNQGIAERQPVIDAETQHNIDKIQEERIAKETAETAKYNAAKGALDSEEIALDGFAERYKTRLDDELIKKQNIENAKLAATKQRIADEEAAISAEKAKVDEQARVKTERAKYDALVAEKEKLKDNLTGFGEVTFGFMIKSLDDKIELERQRLHVWGIPGFATGVTNYSGGTARINEIGGEIVNLPRGANVIPHDLSKRIIDAISTKINVDLNGSIGTNNQSIDYGKIKGAFIEALEYLHITVECDEYILGEIVKKIVSKEVFA